MTSTFEPFTRRRLRCMVLCLLACVMPLQGMTAAAFAMLGPAHVHEPAQLTIRLVDFRRVVAGTAPATHAATPFGHVHRSAAPQRHPHAVGDSSVVPSDDDNAMHALDADAGRGLSAASATLLAWVPASVTWCETQASLQRAWHPLWSPSSGLPERLERPPRPV
ncbi:MAG: hypothetical protein JHC40_21345 [Burkholderiales bacterium]|jgi:hypothetical protein|nr:hypothetical protein [Burkholderiales bacterium]